MADESNTIEGQPCPMCRKNTMTLHESEKEIPYFGKVYLFSMTCTNCKYHKADVESAQDKEPSKYAIEVSGDQDMKIRIVKSSEATVKIPHMITIEPGTAANGFVTNVEGLLNRVKHAIETAKEEAEGSSEKKKAKNMLKKLSNVIWGKDKLKIIIEDPSGNSAIVSERAVKSKLK